MKSILVVDDDADIRALLERFLTKKNYLCETVSSGADAISYLKEKSVDLVICDFKLPDSNGLEILQKIKVLNAQTEVVIITGFSDVRIAVDALKKGAADYVTKPLYPDELLSTVAKAFKKEQPNTKNTPKRPQKEFVEGVSPQSQNVLRHVQLIAPTDMSVIVTGETGTGKEYVARKIHERSERSTRPFFAIDCGAIPKELAGSELFGHVKGAFTGALKDKPGCFEQAHSGTLFMDEIGNLSY